MNLDNIPESLRALKRWVVWRLVDGKKPPVGDDGRMLKEWKSAPMTYEQACARRTKLGESAGLGLLHGDGWGGIDLDACRREDGTIDPRAQLVVDQAKSYTEVSPSGEGLKVFGRSSGWLEMNFSDAARVLVARKPDLYFTVTGQVLLGMPADNDLTGVIEMLLGFFGEAAQVVGGGRTPLPERVPRGTQNDTLFREACRHRAAGKTEEEIYGIMMALRGRCDPQPTPKDIRELTRSACRYEQGDQDEFPQTETGDSEHFASLNAGTLRYDHRRDRWLLFDGVRWRPQTAGEVDRLALDSVRDRQHRSVGSKERMRWALGGESRSRRGNLLALAETVLPLADPGEHWDDDPWLLGVQNGVVDLRTGELRPGRWEDRITMQTRFPYVADARSELWERTVSDIFKDDPEVVDFVHRSLGYSLTGDCREEVFFMCRGDGRNGKGTIINTVAHILGDYHDNLSFHSLERGQFGPREQTNDIAKLVHRRFVTASETTGGRLDESRIKSMTGRDPLTARFLHKEFFTFVPEFKLWLSVNLPPKVRDDSEGFWARTRVIPFLQCYEDRPDKDERLKDKLQVEGEGVLSWLVRGCLRWQESGLGSPPGVKVAVARYRAAEDLLNEFYEECCVLADSARSKPSELFDSYVRWCDRMRVRGRMGSKGFSQQVGKRFKRVTVSGAAQFVGIGLLAEGAEWDQGLGGTI